MNRFILRRKDTECFILQCAYDSSKLSMLYDMNIVIYMYTILLRMGDPKYKLPRYKHTFIKKTYNPMSIA